MVTWRQMSVHMRQSRTVQSCHEIVTFLHCIMHFIYLYTLYSYLFIYFIRSLSEITLFILHYLCVALRYYYFLAILVEQTCAIRLLLLIPLIPSKHVKHNLSVAAKLLKAEPVNTKYQLTILCPKRLKFPLHLLYKKVSDVTVTWRRIHVSRHKQKKQGNVAKTIVFSRAIYMSLVFPLCEY